MSITSKIPFRERLGKGPLLLDGAMGTHIHADTEGQGACFDEYNLTAPEIVADIHRAYLRAGAEILETNTFGANYFKLAAHNLSDLVAPINQAGVEVLRQTLHEAGREDIYVAGSVGPLGVRLVPYGRVSLERAQEAFAEQITVLNDAGVDLLVLETFSDLRELKVAVQAARAINPALPVVASISFTRDDRTLLGDSPAQVAEALTALGVEVAGVNCSNGPAQVARIVAGMRQAFPDTHFSAAPNAGWPENIGGRVMYAASPDYFARFASAMRAHGVSIIGGCCGTNEAHIAAMRTALDNPSSPAMEITRISLGTREETPSGEGTHEPPSKLADRFSRKQFIVAVEMSPPKGVAAEKEIHAAAMLAEAGADVIDVLDSPMARMRMSPWALCYLLQSQVGIEPVLHFPTRGRNLLRVQGDLLAAHALGVRNLFVVMGDPTRIGDYPDAADNYDIVPSGLVHLVKHGLNAGVDSAGNVIGHATNFLVSAALNVNAPDIDKEIGVLRKKIDGGVDYLITQPIYDLSIYERFVARYAELHGPLDRPVLVGLLPLNSLKNALFLHNEVPGITIPAPIMKRMEDAGSRAAEEGVAIAQELAEQVHSLAAGVYLLPQFNRYDLLAEVIESVRQRT